MKFNYELAIKKSLNNLDKVNRNFFNLKQLAFSDLLKILRSRLSMQFVIVIF